MNTSVSLSVPEPSESSSAKASSNWRRTDGSRSGATSRPRLLSHALAVRRRSNSRAAATSARLIRRKRTGAVGRDANRCCWRGTQVPSYRRQLSPRCLQQRGDSYRSCCHAPCSGRTRARAKAKRLRSRHLRRPSLLQLASATSPRSSPKRRRKPPLMLTRSSRPRSARASTPAPRRRLLPWTPLQRRRVRCRRCRSRRLTPRATRTSPSGSAWACRRATGSSATCSSASRFLRTVVTPGLRVLTRRWRSKSWR